MVGLQAQTHTWEPPHDELARRESALKQCCEACDQPFAKIVTRGVGPGIGDVIAGGEEAVDVGNGLRNGDPSPGLHPPENRKTPRVRSNPTRDCPGRGSSGGMAECMPRTG